MSMDRDLWHSKRTQLLYWGVFVAVAFSMTSFILSIIKMAEREDTAFITTSAYNTPGMKKQLRHVVFETSQGDIELALDRLNAPVTVNNFVSFVQQGYYNGTRFHRVEPGQYIAGGDPLSREKNRELWGTGGPGFVYEDELPEGPIRYGDILMDNHGKPNTNGSQFLIVTASSTPFQGNYTLFGHVVKGMEVVEQIALGATDEEGKPYQPFVITDAVMK